MSEIRLKDAKVLIENKRWSGAFYLAGYSIECGLKAKIASQTRKNDFPDQIRARKSHTHKIIELIDISGLKPDFEFEKRSSSQLYVNLALIISEWSEITRYTTISKVRAIQLYEAISDDTNGAMQWLRKHW